MTTPSFPQLYARTRHFTLGVPRNLHVTSDGSRVLFVRTESGTSATGALWAYDIDDDSERKIADPGELLGAAEEQLSPQERARRERSRETGAGIVGFSTDRADRLAALALSGRLWLVEIDGSGGRELPSTGAVIDPKLDPTGRRVAYATADGTLRVVEASDGGADRAVAEPDGEHVVWGQAEFVAGEEMNRHTGYWWAPDGERLLVERYDESMVPVWYIADPAHPEWEPMPHRYPAAGTTNADVTLWIVDLDGRRREVTWDRQAMPYLVRASWAERGPLLLVMSRDQKSAQILTVDVESGTTSVAQALSDPIWLEARIGVPVWLPDGRILTMVDDADTIRLAADGEPFSPVGLQVREVLTAEDAGVVVTASTEPTETQIVRVGYDGSTETIAGEAGVHNGHVSGDVAVVSSSRLDTDGVEVRVLRKAERVGQIRSLHEYAGFRPQVQLLRLGERDLRTAVLFPRDHEPGSRRLPVLMDPYGGPHGQRAVAASRYHLASQWYADQGFAVIVADGRGTPGRGPAWERSVYLELAAVTLRDQVDALAAAVERFPDDLDQSRVGFKGWSYGGYLAAMAVLRRPDVFHAAVAGAPVTDVRLYDTFYQERYLGHPDDNPDVYERNSLIADAPNLERPLLIIHGTSDDNVVFAHTLRLSSALLAAGRPHTVLPLSGVTHMTPQEVVAENLELLQVRFLKESLGA
ncbi:MAG: alpha/beta fold hydrolase [Nocardioidaceae bacterium]